MSEVRMLSPNIPLSRAIYSETAKLKGIDNTPQNEGVMLELENVATRIIEPILEHFGLSINHIPTIITSFYRCPELNAAVGGSGNSQHIRGQAVDIDFDQIKGIDNRELYKYIGESLLFDQLIWEFGNDQAPNWVHVSLKKYTENRRQLIRAYRHRGQVSYERWNPDLKAWDHGPIPSHDPEFRDSLRKELVEKDKRQGWQDRFQSLIDATS